MARSRNIKPAIMVNEELAALPPSDRLLFIYLWMLADREGRLEDRPLRIKAQAFPYDEIDVNAALDRLQAGGFIRRYVAENIKCIQILNFHKHQSPHVRETASTLPSPEKAVPRQCLGSAEASPRSPDSLIPDSLIGDSLMSGKPDDGQANGKTARGVLDYLNAKAGRSYQPVKANLDLIRARLKEYDEATLRRVIDSRVAKWRGTEQEQYLRPATLFNATKCAQYVGDASAGYKPSGVPFV